MRLAEAMWKALGIISQNVQALLYLTQQKLNLPSTFVDFVNTGLPEINWFQAASKVSYVGIENAVARAEAAAAQAQAAAARAAKASVGDMLAGHTADTMIHLTTATERELSVLTFYNRNPPHITPGVFQNSSWVRLGDVSHMTLREYQQFVVGPVAAGNTERVVAFVTHPPTSVFTGVNVPNMANVQEFINRAIVKPAAYVPLPKMQ